ncbi:MAG: VWA-like domain-containing protein [Butyrivibrio sp.]|nr:VWA-like domain-containing protein [Butyrivibrio sp.]
MEEQAGSAKRLELETAGKNVLAASRNELYIAMRFMGQALSSLSYEMDLSTTTLGTDAVSIRFNPSYVAKLFVEEPGRLNRAYIHMLLHCIFRHMYTSAHYEDVRLYDLCADIVTESVLDTMDYRCIYRVSSDYRDRWIAQLEKELKVLTVEKLYRYFSDEKNRPDEFELEKLEREFKADDHGFWQRLPKDDEQDKPPEDDKRVKYISPRRLQKIKDMEKEWEKASKRMQTEMETIGKEASDSAGKLSWLLKFENTDRASFKDFLERFKIIREEGGIDLDSFDYGMYHFGIENYGNMPLIEENEFREVKKISDLVIAIDTSASCADDEVQEFLNATGAILFDRDNFFQKIRVHVIECDEHVQRDEVITSLDDMEKYAKGIKVEGGYGTDFRPVFDYVENLRKKGDLENLKGLLYFTDGYGIYPEKATDYDTGFAFLQDGDYDDEKVPDWAFKLYI